ncbi:hypothetical protein K491DRAFT_33219 [Lophiostoma macrostomum CBS 122681]|uniref:Copper-fist domain-containing protein n=1 Tax=Lophiostoma macrostomum CBS 122681 TaxID=1314788 RepID=A0A6A6T2N4_9PLEO|nr:hypothetical protein K491DRAFT_33219 [Lophiostoma macrostomum CBS 122681]
MVRRLSFFPFKPCHRIRPDPTCFWCTHLTDVFLSGPCIRGHRSSKCDHRDRVLLEVRKPGRPLSSCPHPSGSCSCERVVINYTIPKSSECACPSGQSQPASAVSGSSTRVQKSRGRKSTNTFSPATLERLEEVVKASQKGQIDSTSVATRTPTNTSFVPSEKSSSDETSPPSSASSTPRIVSSPSRRESYSVGVPAVPPSTSESRQTSSCCASKAPPQVLASAVEPQRGSCCGSRPQEQSQIAPVKKACCSGSDQLPLVDNFNHANGHHAGAHAHSQFPQLQQSAQYHHQQYNGMSSGFEYNSSRTMGMEMPIPFNTPIYNHVSGFQQQASVPMSPLYAAHHTGTPATKHNCHCGESCSCFGCAAHPNNATMTEYVRLMHHFMSSGGFGALPPPTYDLPSYPHHSGVGAEPHQSMNYGHDVQPASFMPFAGGQAPFQASMSNGLGMSQTPIPTTAPWQQSSISTPIQPQASPAPQFINPTTNHARHTTLELKTENHEATPTMADSPQESQDEDTQLSPSSYFWQELVLPGCNDATGTCQCGDGCQCVGCLTHGGHNGVPLQAASTNGHDAFTSFMASDSFQGTHTNFMPGM